MVRYAGRGRVSIDYLELFPAQFRLVLGPGSGVFSDDDELVMETATRFTDEVRARFGRVVETILAAAAAD